MFARRVQDRRMEILGLFEDHAATHWAGPGHVTVNQFARAIDLLGFRLTRHEITSLCNLYCDTDMKNEFNYVAFCAEVDPIFGRDGRVKGKSEAYEKFLAEMKGPEVQAHNKLPGNPYFDVYGQVKPICKDMSFQSPRTAKKDAALLRAGFQPVGATIVGGSGTNTPLTSPKAKRHVTDFAGDGFATMAGPLEGDDSDSATAAVHAPPGGVPLEFKLDNGKLVGVNADGIDDDMARIQAQVFRRRIRTKEFFKGWDPRQTGRVTREQFSRGIANIIYPNTFYDPETPVDIDALIEHFVDFTPGVTEPSVVSYANFCKVLDGVFNKHGLENRPTTSVPKPGAGVIDAGGFAPRPVSDEEGVKKLLRRIAYLVEIHGVELNNAFNDCQRSDADIRTGRVSAFQFMQHFPLAKSTPTTPAYLKKADMELLIQRYTDDNGWVRLFSFQGDILEVQKKKPQLIERRMPKTLAKWADHNSINTIVGRLGL